jgi:YidC/Oxa1 family membrane protein insertase
LNAELHDAIDLGWFSFLAIPIREILVFFHRIAPNWGVAIIMLTMFIKLLLFPVTHKAFVSMEKMRELQPQIAALQKKYENDRMKLGEEQMKLFRESGTSPFGGCLPMILQMPIYIALYRTIQGTTELYNAPFVLWIQDLSHQDPYLILPLLMGVTMWGQNKLSPQAIDNPQMAAVQKIMPFMFTAFMLFLPSGLVLYIFVNMLLSIAQQLYIRRSLEKKRAGTPART